MVVGRFTTERAQKGTPDLRRAVAVTDTEGYFGDSCRASVVLSCSRKFWACVPGRTEHVSLRSSSQCVCVPRQPAERLAGILGLDKSETRLGRDTRMARKDRRV